MYRIRVIYAYILGGYAKILTYKFGTICLCLWSFYTLGGCNKGDIRNDLKGYWGKLT